MHNIAYVQISGNSGGAAKSLYYLISGLDKNKYNAFAVFARGGDFIDKFDEICVETDVIQLGVLRNNTHTPFSFTPQNILMVLYCFVRLPVDVYLLYRFFKSRRIDLVYINVSVLLSAGIAAKLSGAKVIWHIREILVENLLGKFHIWCINQCADKIINISEYYCKQFDARKVECIYNSVPVDEKIPIRSKEEIRSIAAAESEDFIFMIFGNLVKEVAFHKGFYDFVDAGLLFNEKKVKFWIIGDSPAAGFFERAKRAVPFFSKKYLSEKEILTNKANTSGQRSLFKFLGRQPDIFSFINAADVIVIPHRVPEPFGRTLIEAGLFKKPVITSNLKPTDEIVTDRRTGLLIKPGNIQELIACMKLLKDDKTLRETLGNAFFKDIQQRFNTKTNNNKIYSLYAAVLGEDGKGCLPLN